MTKKELLKMIEGKVLTNERTMTECIKERDEFIQEIQDLIRGHVEKDNWTEREVEYWTPKIEESDNLVVTYGNYVHRIKRPIEGICKVRSKDIIIGTCYVDIVDIITILDNGFITKNGNKYVLV